MPQTPLISYICQAIVDAAVGRLVLELKWSRVARSDMVPQVERDASYTHAHIPRLREQCVRGCIMPSDEASLCI